MFFCSSRRRHTRWTGDWSSDVCSSDLSRAKMLSCSVLISVRDYGINTLQDNIFARESWLAKTGNEDVARRFVEATLKGWRSEERRVGKECRLGARREDGKECDAGVE